MRIVTYGAACSLDGFIAGADGAMDWLHFSRDVQDIMGSYWKTVDTVLMGRKTWEAAQAMGGGGGGMRGIRSYVFSRTLKPSDHPGVNIVADDAAEFVRALKGKRGKDICVMGGSELARSLIDAGVVDEVGFNMHPVLLGSGVPLFQPGARRVTLELRESRVIDGGCVYATYRLV